MEIEHQISVSSNKDSVNALLTDLELSSLKLHGLPVGSKISCAKES